MGTQKEGDEGRRPEPAVEDVEVQPGLEDEFDHGPAEESETLVVVQVIPMLRAEHAVAQEILGIVDKEGVPLAQGAAKHGRLDLLGPQGHPEFGQHRFERQPVDLRSSIAGQGGRDLSAQGGQPVGRIPGLPGRGAVRERRQFGQPIGRFQSVSNRLADMKVRLETARLLLYKVAWVKQQGKSAVMEAALAKLYLSECFVQSSLDAIRIHGGYGYMTEFEVERDLRDAVGGTIYSGTSDIQRTIISRLLGV